MHDSAATPAPTSCHRVTAAQVRSSSNHNLQDQAFQRSQARPRTIVSSSSLRFASRATSMHSAINERRRARRRRGCAPLRRAIPSLAHRSTSGGSYRSRRSMPPPLITPQYWSTRSARLIARLQRWPGQTPMKRRTRTARVAPARRRGQCKGAHRETLPAIPICSPARRFREMPRDCITTQRFTEVPRSHWLAPACTVSDTRTAAGSSSIATPCSRPTTASTSSSSSAGSGADVGRPSH